MQRTARQSAWNEDRNGLGNRPHLHVCVSEATAWYSDRATVNRNPKGRTMDPFDTPEIIPSRDEAEPGRVARAVARAGQLSNATLAGPALAWKQAGDRRAEARNPDALDAVRDANRAHRDAMRDLRRDRRAFEKAREEVGWWNVVNGERRAARSVVRDTAQMAREAKQVQREARKAYPLALPALAARCHVAHAVPTFLWHAVADSATSAIALCASFAAIAANVAVARVAGRHAATDDAGPELDALQPSQEERDLLQRLDPKAWHAVAEPRGLVDVVAAGATLTASGIQAKLTLNGTMDLATLRKRVPQLRAALRLREGTRLELREGKTGGHARLTLRTRSASAGIDLTGWKPGDCWAVNTVTGELVKAPLGKRLLIAGTSGSGKSWSARPLLAEASEWDDHRLVIFDRKYIEGRTWEHRARIVTELEEMDALCDELEAEGEERLKLIPRGRDVVEISSTRPRITVFVDEGGELITDCVREWERIIDRLRTVARKYRAAEIILVWATQKPTMSGKGYGIDSQIAGQMQDRLCLAVTTATESRTIFGEDAAETGWQADKLPMPGFALYKQLELGPKCVPQMLQMRAMSPQQVIDLPSRPVWSRAVSSTGVTQLDLDVRQALEAAGDPWADKTVADGPSMMKKPRVSAEDRDDQILDELAKDPCRSLSSIASAIGASKSVVKRRLEQMEADGLVVQDENKCWHPVP